MPWDDDFEAYSSKRKEEKCEDCGVTSEDLMNEGALVYDEDGNLLCTDCLFERESMRDLEDDEDAENYV
jgi:hypothetical protein